MSAFNKVMTAGVVVAGTCIGFIGGKGVATLGLEKRISEGTIACELMHNVEIVCWDPTKEEAVE